ncbi:MAG: UDP-N-acetylmuramate dehydrogenase [Candidatus Gastranaerophilaceae bacterium]|jgi:UDP-N-acetylmuramate dehydrogenase
MDIKLISKNCFKDYPLAKHSTLKVGGNAEFAYFPQSVEELIQITSFHRQREDKITVIGAGSNVLISSKGITGAVILTKNLDSCELTGHNCIKAGSGLKSTMLSKFAHKNGLSGVEFLIGIPGLVGGAVYMNSGAHGQQIKDTIVSAEVFDLKSDGILNFSKENLGLEYRHSRLIDGEHIVLNAVFRLQEENPEKIQEFMTYQLDYRTKNHPPLSEPNAGSTFRNPENGIYIGKLLEDLNAKDWSEGGAAISKKHANFLHNFDNATSLDISKLMFKMYSEVKKQYGYELLAEIRYLGDMEEEEEEIWAQFQKLKH